MDKCYIKIAGEDHVGYGLCVIDFEKEENFPPKGYTENNRISIRLMDLQASVLDSIIATSSRIAVSDEDCQQIVAEINPDKFDTLKKIFDEGNLTFVFDC